MSEIKLEEFQASLEAYGRRLKKIVSRRSQKKLCKASSSRRCLRDEQSKIKVEEEEWSVEGLGNN